MPNGSKAGRGRDEWIEFWRDKLKREWERRTPDPPGVFGVRIEVVAEWQGDTVHRLAVATEEVPCGERWPSPPCVCYIDTITRDYDLHVKFTVYAVLTIPAAGGGTQDVEEIIVLKPDGSVSRIRGRKKVGWGTWAFGISNEVRKDHRVDCGDADALKIPNDYVGLPGEEVVAQLLDPRRATLVLPGALVEARGEAFLPRGLEFSLYGEEELIAVKVDEFVREERFEEVSDPEVNAKVLATIEPHVTEALQNHACACPEVNKEHPPDKPT